MHLLIQYYLYSLIETQRINIVNKQPFIFLYASHYPIYINLLKLTYSK